MDGKKRYLITAGLLKVSSLKHSLQFFGNSYWCIKRFKQAISQWFLNDVINLAFLLKSRTILNYKTTWRNVSADKPFASGLRVAHMVSVSVWAGLKWAIGTTLGDFTIELSQEQAPISVDNFLKYVADEMLLRGTIFHRVIPGFMAQRQQPNQDMNQQATCCPIKNEGSNGLRMIQQRLQWLRTNAPDSATRQFFINFSDNDFLNTKGGNPGYAVFRRWWLKVSMSYKRWQPFRLSEWVVSRYPSRPNHHQQSNTS